MIWQVLKNVRELPYDQKIPLLGYNATIFIAYIITHNCQTLQTVRMSIIWWKDRQNVEHSDNKYHVFIKKEWSTV